MLNKIKRRLYYTVEIQPHNSLLSRSFGYFITALVFITILDMALETEKDIYEHFKSYFHLMDSITVTIFVIEYIIRIWTCNLHKNYHHKNYTHPFWGRVRFALTPFLLVDLLAFLPYLINLVLPGLLFVDLRFLRLFRIIKLVRYFRSLRMLARVVRRKQEELTMVLALILIVLFVFSTLMYYVENAAQPDKFSSIFASMWWAVITLSTVGYGDICPVTNLGKILSGFISILGIGIFALPTAIISTGFAQVLRDSKKTFSCPHCGREISSPTERINYDPGTK